MDFWETYERVCNALKAVKLAVIANWQPFLTLLLVYTLIVILLCRAYYKHERAALTALKESLDIQSKELKSKDKEYEQMAVKYQEMKREIESPGYQAYLLARNLESTDMDDSKMFERNKKIRK